jgi:hypothetical protein
VLTYDPHNKVVIALVRVSEGKGDGAKTHLETWAFDAGKRTWTKMNPPKEPTPSGSRARLLTFLPDHGVALLENRTHPPTAAAEQQMWTYRYAFPSKEKQPERAKSKRVYNQPPLVEDVVASVKSVKEVELSWKAPPGGDVAGYQIERAVVEVWTEDELNVEKKHTPPLKEPSVASLRRIGAFETLTKKPVKELKWTDKVDLSTPQKVEGKPIWERRRDKSEIDEKGKPYRHAVYAYRVRAVNKQGVAGGPSPYVLTIPSAPQHAYSREHSQGCDLKWARNSELGLKGYRVYRLDGRWGNQPVSRLTAEPTTKTTFTDEKAGKVARRYHVVAVDSIGQEGIPSAPVWFEREWKSFYVPFVGEWHQ